MSDSKSVIEDEGERRRKVNNAWRSHDVKQRIKSGLRERICMIGESSSGPINEYQVCSATTTGKSYKVEVKQGHDFTCSCPDFKFRQQYCKHIYFILFRVFRLPSDRDTLPSKEEIWTKVIERSSSLSTEKGAEEWKIAYSTEAIETEELAPGVKLKEFKGEDCAICFEQMTEDDMLKPCTQQCGQYFHTACINVWLKFHKTCALCRVRWSVS